MIVVDASVILELLLRTAVAQELQDRLFDTAESLHAPALLDIEVAHVLRRYAIRGELSGESGRFALGVLARFPIIRYQHDALLSRIWALRQNLTAYDAAYVALAEVLPAKLLTRDAGLAAASGHRATIELV